MSRNKLRKYQIEANEAIVQELTTNNSKKCLVKMFCGTGKSTIMRTCPVTHSVNLLVYVFPSLSLISQFTHDYLKTENPLHILKISSDDNSTTECSVISAFLSQPFNKIICVTYQSFATLIDNLDDQIIDVCIFDEAHHAVGQTYQQLIFNDCAHSNKQIFFTATPKNTNGIVMYEKNATSNCGKMVYDYSYYRGITEGYLNPFEIRLDFYTEHNNHSIYESICRAILASGNNRVLTFHSDVNTERDTSVNNFVNQLDLDTAFNKILNEEFCEKIGKYSKIKIVGLSSSIVATCSQCLEKIKKMIHRPTNKSCCRYNILEYFDKTKDNEIFIISSCETIGEGIDTKNANACVFVDPKSSYVSIMQNIGRIVRKNGDRPSSTILIPCWVDREKYLNCGEDKDKCDEAIREDLGAQGNFNQILNVMSALRQEDEELYDICLHYPDKYSPQEIQSNLEKQGFMIKDAVGEGNLLENVEYLLDEEIDCENYEDSTDEETLMQIASDFGVNIEIHCNSLETPIEKYISQESLESDSDLDSVSDDSKENPKKTIRLYKTIDEETEENIYSPIVEKTRNGGEKKQSLKNIEAPDRKKRVNINAHTNPDVKVLWNVSSDICGLKDVCSCVIDCEVVDNWYIRFEELKKFIDENERRPNSRHNNDENKTLENWLNHQMQNYKKMIESMKNVEKYNLWTQFLKDYCKYFELPDEIWHKKFKELKYFIDENKTKPERYKGSNDEQMLANWMSKQIENYKMKKKGMKCIDRYNLWTEFLKNYGEYFKSLDDIWYETFEELNNFINDNNKPPSSTSKIIFEKKLGVWKLSQISNHKNKKYSMKDEIKYNLWTQFLEKYDTHFKSGDEIWDNNLTELENFINENKKRPNCKSMNIHERKLSNWMLDQYKACKNECMESVRYEKWNDFLKEYEHHINTYDFIWNVKFNNLKQFIDKYNKRPSNKSKNYETKILGEFLVWQNKNYKFKKGEMKDPEKYILWTKFLNDNVELFKSTDDVWYAKFDELKTFINESKKKPSRSSENEKSMGQWINSQNINYKNKKGEMKDPEKCILWTKFLIEYKGILNLRENIIDNSITIDDTHDLKEEPIEDNSPQINDDDFDIIPASDEESEDEPIIIVKKSTKLQRQKVWIRNDEKKNDEKNDIKKNKEPTDTQQPPTNTETNTTKRTECELTQYHRKYITMRSDTLANHFRTNRNEFTEYHLIRDANLEKYDKRDHPHEKIIAELDKIKTKRQKLVVDMGCGLAKIA